MVLSCDSSSQDKPFEEITSKPDKGYDPLLNIYHNTRHASAMRGFGRGRKIGDVVFFRSSAVFHHMGMIAEQHTPAVDLYRHLLAEYVPLPQGTQPR